MIKDLEEKSVNKSKAKKEGKPKQSKAFTEDSVFNAVHKDRLDEAKNSLNTLLSALEKEFKIKFVRETSLSSYEFFSTNWGKHFIRLGGATNSFEKRIMVYSNARGVIEYEGYVNNSASFYIKVLRKLNQNRYKSNGLRSNKEV